MPDDELYLEPFLRPSLSKQTALERDRQLLTEYYNSRLNIPEFAKRKGLKPYQVRDRLRKYGLRARPVSNLDLHALKVAQVANKTCPETYTCKCGEVIKTVCLPCQTLRKQVMSKKK